MPHAYLSAELTAKEPGFAYLYISNESATLVDGYFDDVTMTHTPSNVIQYNEYYPFQNPTQNSWTRVNAVKNNFLGNGGTELNTTSQLYDLEYRAYDPILGRMNGVDPMADKYSSLSPYNFSFNSPVMFNDPSGAEPPTTVNGSATTSPYHIMYTYDDRIDPGSLSQPICSQCWREGNAGAMAFYGAAMGRSFGESMSFGLSPYSAAYYNQMRQDAGSVSPQEYGAKYGEALSGYWQRVEGKYDKSQEYTVTINGERVTVLGEASVEERWVSFGQQTQGGGSEFASSPEISGNQNGFPYNGVGLAMNVVGAGFTPMKNEFRQLLKVATKSSIKSVALGGKLLPPCEVLSTSQHKDESWFVWQGLRCFFCLWQCGGWQHRSSLSINQPYVWCGPHYWWRGLTYQQHQRPQRLP